MEEWGARAGSGQGRDLQGLDWGDLSPGEMVTENCQESPSESLEMGLITPSPAPRGLPPSSGGPGQFGAGAALTAAPGGQDRGQQQQQDERQPHAGAGQGDTGGQAQPRRTAGSGRMSRAGSGDSTGSCGEAASAQRGRVSTNGAEL